MSHFSHLTPDAIRRHQTNNSKTKIACAFSKSKRFQEANPQCKQAFYSYKSTLSKKNMVIGKGKRSDFTKTLTSSPASTKYLHQSTFEENKMKGKTFALSRDRSPDRSYHNFRLHKIPGPGQYEPFTKTMSNVSYSMRKKTSDFIKDKITIKDNPGPGKYDELSLSPKEGRFRLSKFGDTKYCKINPKPQRFVQGKDSPSPLSYIEFDGVSNRGKYVLSQRTGRGTRPFDNEKRIPFTDNFKKNKSTIPGPGSYDRPSDFGLYGKYGDDKMKATIG